jgi:hypothetical protein
MRIQLRCDQVLKLTGRTPPRPAFEQGLEDVALVELGIAGERDHPAGRVMRRDGGNPTRTRRQPDR